MLSVRRYWWVFAAAVYAFTMALIVGLGLVGASMLALYAVLNCAGVWMYCEQLRHRRPTRQVALRLLAVALVPVGLVVVFATPGGLTPSEQSAAGSADERIRKGAAGAPQPRPPSPGL